MKRLITKSADEPTYDRLKTVRSLKHRELLGFATSSFVLEMRCHPCSPLVPKWFAVLLSEHCGVGSADSGHHLAPGRLAML